MLKNPAETLTRLLEIPSPTGHEQALAEALVRWINDELPLDTLELQEVDGRSNVIGLRGRPRLLLTSHLDTVPTLTKPRADAGYIYGTGACDAKGQIAVQLAAIASAAARGLESYGFFFVVGEEVDSAGAKHVIRHPSVRGESVLLGEPTGNRFARRSRGFEHYLVRVRGREAHSSADDVDSAIHTLVVDLASVMTGGFAGTHLNVGRIDGGSGANVVAGCAEAHVSFRPAAGDVSLLARLQTTASHCEVSLIDALDPVEFYVPPAYRENAVDVSYCSDAEHYRGAFGRVMMFGPGSIAVAHSPEEHVPTAELDAAVSVLTSLLVGA